MRTRQLVAVALALAVVGILVGGFRAVAGEPDASAVPPQDPCIRSC